MKKSARGTFLLTAVQVQRLFGTVWLMHIAGPCGDDFGPVCSIRDRDVDARVRRGEESALKVETLGDVLLRPSDFRKIRKDFVEGATIGDCRIFSRVLDEHPKRVYPELYTIMCE